MYLSIYKNTPCTTGQVWNPTAEVTCDGHRELRVNCECWQQPRQALWQHLPLFQQIVAAECRIWAKACPGVQRLWHIEDHMVLFAINCPLRLVGLCWQQRQCSPETVTCGTAGTKTGRQKMFCWSYIFVARGYVFHFSCIRKRKLNSKTTSWHFRGKKLNSGKHNNNNNKKPHKVKISKARQILYKTRWQKLFCEMFCF